MRFREFYLNSRDMKRVLSEAVKCGTAVYIHVAFSVHIHIHVAFSRFSKNK